MCQREENEKCARGKNAPGIDHANRERMTRLIGESNMNVRLHIATYRSSGTTNWTVGQIRAIRNGTAFLDGRPPQPYEAIARRPEFSAREPVPAPDRSSRRRRRPSRR
ncbi:hypothetical protein Psi02_11680 [Planotetraspora silvatica]|uniref:Uncharacterized protein n=1 Tax=Planotetraspora silvatica TaxID=234614 RepID=A0A8J3UM09_9ACTN|nr:hypothetical protein Psi02_11680 [Planotetraspora silvatica]